MLREVEQNEMGDVERGSRFSFRHFSFRSGSDSTCIGFDSPWNRVLVYGFLFVTVALTVCGFYFCAAFLRDKDINAAIWAFLTAGIALCLTSLFVLHLLRKLEYWHNINTLDGIKIFGMGMSVISGVALGVYFILGFLRHQNMDTKGENYFRAALFSGLCLGCNLLVYFAAQWYLNIMMPRMRPPPIMSIRR